MESKLKLLESGKTGRDILYIIFQEQSDKCVFTYIQLKKQVLLI